LDRASVSSSSDCSASRSSEAVISLAKNHESSTTIAPTTKGPSSIISSGRSISGARTGHDPVAAHMATRAVPSSSAISAVRSPALRCARCPGWPSHVVVVQPTIADSTPSPSNVVVYAVDTPGAT
jgi:hypothetical protein